MSTGTVKQPADNAAGVSSGVFSRSSSGLIRVAGGWDVFIYNIGLVSVGIAIAWNQYLGQASIREPSSGCPRLLP